MRVHRIALGFGLLTAVMAAAPLPAQETAPDRRAPRVASGDAARQNLLDLLQQLEALQVEVQQLRNSVEVQGHDIEQLKSRQRSLYDDLDKRLREVERRTPAAAATAAPEPVAGAAPRATTASQQQDYDAAFGLMKQGLHERAIKSFREFLVKYPDSGLVDNAQYWIAEGNYVLRNYKLSIEEFAKLANNPQSAKAPDALLKIGYAHYELNAWDKSRKTLTEVQARYPGTSFAKLAAARLEKMKKEGH
jgi:tol-pal system protein YbgF